jgi:hypothetical protein
MKWIVTHTSRGDARRKLQLLTGDRTNFHVLETCHAVLQCSPNHSSSLTMAMTSATRAVRHRPVRRKHRPIRPTHVPTSSAQIVGSARGECGPDSGLKNYNPRRSRGPPSWSAADGGLRSHRLEPERNSRASQLGTDFPGRRECRDPEGDLGTSGPRVRAGAHRHPALRNWARIFPDAGPRTHLLGSRRNRCPEFFEAPRRSAPTSDEA